MITLLMFISLWIATAKDIKPVKYLNLFFLIFLLVTAIININTLYLLPIGATYIGFAIYALFAKWPTYAVDKPRKFKKRWIQHPAEVLGHRTFIWIFKLVPLPVLSWVGGKLLETFGPKTRRQKIAEKNLAMIMPENNNPEFIKKMWNNWGRTFAEGLKYPTYKKHMKRYITIKNHEIFKNSGQTLIALPHMGYMGLMSLSFIKGGKKIGVTYKFPSNPLSNEILLENYGDTQVDEVSFIHTGNAFPMMRALKNGDSLNINSDQRVHAGERLLFLGRPARTSTGITQLARKFNLPIIIGHVQRTHGAHHMVVFDEMVNIPRTDDAHADEVAGMQMVNDAMGRAIRKSPSEYLWVHRRWA